MKTIKKTAILILTFIIIGAFTISASAADHYVVRGDTMWNISRSYGVSLESLIKANPHIKNPNLIYPGDKLYVPDGSGSTAQTVSAQASEVLRLTNNYRSQNGKRSLVLDSELCRVAQAKADDMAAKGYFSHTSPTYGSPSQMLSSFGIGYRYMGENIAKGYTEANAVVTGWMNSQGHRENILNGSFGKLGVGYNASAKTWVQVFTD